MARYALVFLAAAVLCTAVLAQDVVPAHRGNNGGIHTKYSVYHSNTQRYRPVKCGRNLCLYRIHTRLIVETYNRNQPTLLLLPPLLPCILGACWTTPAMSPPAHLRSLALTPRSPLVPPTPSTCLKTSC
ncbi:hypothetical protein COO60DRAFT_235497 [Scenedesmus sp. NREL 46B-D3]|nr:hypothetical protein COO60DRAFT_235497 [Scenedesmus sp. NREL 46B-D3]